METRRMDRYGAALVATLAFMQCTHSDSPEEAAEPYLAAMLDDGATSPEEVQKDLDEELLAAEEDATAPQPNAIRCKAQAMSQQRFSVLRKGVKTVLGWVYDANDSKVLEEAEVEALKQDLATRRQSLLAAFDADGDSCLNREELDQRKLELTQAFQAAFDLNADGKVSREEIQQRREARRQQIDAEGDGLTPEEKAMLRGEAQERVRTGWFAIAS